MERTEVKTNDLRKGKLLKQVVYAVSNLTVEPVIFLAIFSSTTYQLIAQNLYLEKACRLNIGFNSSICDALSSRNDSGYNKSQEIEVQKVVSDMLAVRTAILSFFPICLIVLVGSWSDRHNRRKPFILAPISGEMLCCLSLIVNVIFFYELPLIITVLADYLPLALLGGWPCLFIGIYTYVGVRCSDENRSMKMGAVSAAKMSAHSLGFSVAGLIFGALGFIGFFSICILLQLTAFCLGILLVKENKTVEKKEKMTGKIKDFFNITSFKNSLQICFNKKPNNRRFKFIIIILLTVIVAGPSNGEMNVNYMNARLRFGWNAVKFGLFFSLSVVLEVFGAMFDVFRMVPYIAMRSLMSKVVPHQELGQSNSIFGLLYSVPFIQRYISSQCMFFQERISL